MEIGLVRTIDIDNEMQQSYLDYAMSVIVSRALPDARDGLKPVHRRILHAMNQMGLRPDTSFKKSARVVGEVLGKFHPHGDMAVYEAMARMAQDFSLRYQLVEGQGNFGSIDGDPPAAMRYTEARMASPAMDMMSDIDKDTVDFIPNFDGSLQEPVVLPAALPNMLINGATGIAVGMATSIPPHNLSEVSDALVYMLQNWSKLDQLKLEDLMKFIQGPDFPTGGMIVRNKTKDADPLVSAYATGRGKLTVQARAHIEEMDRGRQRILVTELPYQVNKANLIEKIADLVRGGDLEGITDLRDESDRQGMRIVLELSKSTDPKKMLAELYKRTLMQTTFSVIMLALVDGKPRLLSLKQSLRVYLEHRLEVVRRRSEYDLTRAKERAHILEGYRIALTNLDEVITIIRKAHDVDQAHERLTKRFKLSDIQTRAILDMPLRRLASLERKKIDIEYKEVMAKIKILEALLASERKLREAVADEILQVKEKYGDRRRTLIASATGSASTTILTATDLYPAKDCYVILTKDGLLSRTTTARTPRLSGRNAPQLVLQVNVRDHLYLFNSEGETAAVAVHTLPECENVDEGSPLKAVTPFSNETEIVAGLALPVPSARKEKESGFLCFGTLSGTIKKSEVEILPGPSAKPFTSVKVTEGDRLGWVVWTGGNDELILVSSDGLAIRFSEEEVRPMGLVAAGVSGMKLSEDATIVGMDRIQPRSDLLIVSQDGQAKRIKLSEFPTQGRYGKGVLVWKSGEDVTLIGAAVGQADSRATIWLNRGAARSLRFGDAARRARGSRGDALLLLKDSQHILSITPATSRPELPPSKTKK
ncbi:MAG: DNA gyrase subunit A [Anaerolineales bacterium]|nr:DNA gyrase subunit A [Anaerolineales bacterium]